MNEFTDDSFENEVENSTGIVVVDFWAAWCRPCIMLKPLFSKVADNLTEVKFGTINIEENTQMTSKYSISALPSILIFKDGKQVDKLIGLPNEAKLTKAIQDLL